jgi:hypothetical protein
MLSDTRRGSLPAIMFHLALWHMDLGYFGRGLLGSWPQSDIGIVLWLPSVSAGDWQSSEKLTRLCTIPEPAMFSGTWHRTSYYIADASFRPVLGVPDAARFLGELRLVDAGLLACAADCQSACKRDPLSASKRDPPPGEALSAARPPRERSGGEAVVGAAPWRVAQERFLNRQLSLPVSTMSQ